MPSARQTLAMFAIAAAVCLVFVQPRWSFLENWQYDEGYYMARTEAVFGNQVSFGKEADRQYGNFVAPLTSYIWVPLAAVAKVLGGWTASDATEWTWSAVAACGFAFWVLAWFAWRSLLRIVTPATSAPPSFLVMSASFFALPILYYAGHRPLLPHTIELTLALLTVALALKKRFAGAVAAAAALTLTRYNDAPVFLLVVGAALDARRGKGQFDWRAHKRVYLAAGIAGAAALALVGWVAFGRGYGGATLPSMLALASRDRLAEFFFGASWGVFWIIPLWPLIFLVGLVHARHLSWAARGGLAWMAAMIGLYSMWDGSGGDFSHRYLIGTMAAAALIAAELWPRVSTSAGARKAWRALLFASAAWMIFLTFTYKTVLATAYRLGHEELAENGVKIYVADPYLGRLFANVLNPEVYKTALAQSLFGTLWLSYQPAREAGLAKFVLAGPHLIVATTLGITAAVVFALSVFLLGRDAMRRRA